MAYQTSGGTKAPTKQGMQDRIDSNIARDGAAKRPQKSVATTHGQRSRIGEVAGVHGSGAGPDASAPSPLDPTAPGKKFGQAPVKWGMKDQSAGNGAAVLREASNLGR